VVGVRDPAAGKVLEGDDRLTDGLSRRYSKIASRRSCSCALICHAHSTWFPLCRALCFIRRTKLGLIRASRSVAWEGAHSALG